MMLIQQRLSQNPISNRATITSKKRIEELANIAKFQQFNLPRVEDTIELKDSHSIKIKMFSDKVNQSGVGSKVEATSTSNF